MWLDSLDVVHGSFRDEVRYLFKTETTRRNLSRKSHRLTSPISTLPESCSLELRSPMETGSVSFQKVHQVR